MKVWLWSLDAFLISKDTHREKACSNKTQELTKNFTMDIWVVEKLNQLFVRGFYNKIMVLKK